MDFPLFDKEIERYIPNVVIYKDLSSLKNIKLPMVVLYQTNNTGKHWIGHWVLIHETSDSVEFFDPLGIFIDKEFQLISPELQYPHYVSHLLRSINKPISYNQYPFQKEGTSTCGRWVLLRHFLSKFSLNEFQYAINYFCNKLKLDPDELVIQLTSSINTLP